MPIIKCKMCGGDIQLAEDKTYGMCEYCGSTMTLPKVSDDQRAAAFNRGNHFRRMGEFDKALGVYERIVAEDDTDAEAHWCCALSRFGIEYVEDPATYEWLPTCHRASFDSFLEDVDYLAAVEHSDGITRRQYQKDAAKIAEVQRGILATSQNTEPYDVFISYKELDENGERTRDSILAQEIYYRLTEKGWRVFFSRITLEDVPGTQYEPYIFAALNSAKVMIVVGTSAENLNAVWVKNEWSRFLSMMRKDRSKLLIPCYRDMDPYDLPEQLSVLMSYDMGKIGFIQDLIRGVDKVLSAEKKEHEPVKETVKETVVVQQGEGAMKTAAAVKRGQLALEESNWEQAKTYFEQALTFDAECAEAYFGMALAEGHYHSAEEYAQRATTQAPGQNSLYIAQNNEHIRDIITQYSIPRFLDERTIESYYKNYAPGFSSTAEGQRKLLEKEKTSFENNRNFSLAYRFAKGQYQQTIEDFKRSLYAALEANVLEAEQAEREAADQKKAEYKAFLEKTDKQIKELHQQKKTERESMYLKACKDYDAAVYSSQYRSARNVFQSLADFKDSKEYIQKCDERIDELDKKARIEQEEKRKENQYNTLHKIFDTDPSNSVQLNVWETAKQGFEGLGEYKDSPACAQQCAKVIEQIKLAKEAEEKAAAEEAERQRILAEKAEKEKKAKEKKTGIITGIIVVLAIAAALIITYVIIPGNQYKEAEGLFEAGRYDEAIAAFEAMDGYKDSAKRVEEIKDAIHAPTYAEAEALVSSGDIIGAVQLFDSLGDYKDSRERAESIRTSSEYRNSVIKKADVGDVVAFGTYEQNNKSSDGREEIEWIVLAKEDDRILVISKYGLDCQPYNSNKTDVTWEECSLRGWLNSVFFNSAFNKEEQARIPTVVVNADQNPDFNTSPGNNTEDKVFLLSIPEVNKYFADKKVLCSPTAYAVAQGSKVVNIMGYGMWWLRSPGSVSNYASFVGADLADRIRDIYVNHNVISVRPALWIEFDS